MVECFLAKEEIAGSNPVSRSYKNIAPIKEGKHGILSANWLPLVDNDRTCFLIAKL